MRGAHQRGLTAIDGAVALIAVWLILQMGCSPATIEAFLAGHNESIPPAAIISGVIFAACFALFFFIKDVDGASPRYAPTHMQHKISPGSHGPSPPGEIHPGFLSHSFDDGVPLGVKWLLQTDLDACTWRANM